MSLAFAHDGSNHASESHGWTVAEFRDWTTGAVLRELFAVEQDTA